MKKFFDISLFKLIILTLIINLVFNNCDGTEENGTPTGAVNGSPEDSLIQELASEYGEIGLEPRLRFLDGPINEFIEEILEFLDDTYGHLDFVIIYSEYIDTLISTGWIEPYPEKIDEEDFDSLAVVSMKRDSILYGVPLFLKGDSNERVKGVCISPHIHIDTKEPTLLFIKYISLKENSRRIAEAAGGRPARIN